MRYLDDISRCVRENPDNVAVQTSLGVSCTYAELWDTSEALASLIESKGLPVHAPVVVYGHKDPLVVASFLACLKSGHPYVPVDCFSVPPERVGSIVAQVGDYQGGAPLVLALEDILTSDAPCDVCARAALEDAVHAGGASDSQHWVCGEDLAYVLFTSGSTGAPKGVMVTADCLDNFSAWALSLGGSDKRGKVFLNQAPFSFDLSVYELSMALSAGGTLFCLAKQTQDSMRTQLDALARSAANVWVSTPSFAAMCLASKEFDASVLSDLEQFLFCGETLPNSLAAQLMERFPNAKVFNTYGPTESTVAVAAIEVTPEMAASDAPLPVGIARPGTRLRIVADDGQDAPRGEWGEIVIEGDTVARGYLGRPDLTQAAFGSAVLDGREVRSYRTGDEGRLDAGGALHYHGRLDLQVKLNGYRIELGDIEGNIAKLDQVAQVAVTCAMRDGRVNHLVAHVVSAVPRAESDFRESLKLKEAMKESLPHYMIPKKIVFCDALPTTPNGKVDRKALQQAL